MDYNTLLDLVADLGYRLAMNGAETFRVEESINLITKSYGVQSEVFAIPSCIIVSIETDSGKPMTRMRRVEHHGNNLDSVEKFSNLSRRICSEHPEPHVAYLWMRDVDASQLTYPKWINIIANFLIAYGFAFLFGCSLMDCLWCGVCGILVGYVSETMERMQANQFFRTIIASFILAFAAYTLTGIGLVGNADTVIIGALMLLVPGLLFTNAMRDIIYGDTNSGINRVVQVFLIAVGIALGTAVALMISEQLWGIHTNAPKVIHSVPLQLFGSIAACIGFSIVFNIHGFGMLLCAFGGALAWAAYLLTLELGAGDLVAFFVAGVISSLYAEIMARIRKYPAISYLVIAIIPFIPGSNVYYTMTHAVRGDMASFFSVGMHTVAITGVIAVGILLVSTSFRIWVNYKRTRK